MHATGLRSGKVIPHMIWSNIDIGEELEEELIAWLDNHPELGSSINALTKQLLADWLVVQAAHEQRGHVQTTTSDEVNTAAS